jgi:hypothetical protein
MLTMFRFIPTKLASILVAAWFAWCGLALRAVEPEQPISAADRVGFVSDYARILEQVRHSYLAGRAKVITVYVNPAAGTVTLPEQRPYPAGSVIVFEWADPVKDPQGQVLRKADGSYAKGPVTRVDVMRREPGYGGAYGEHRAGEWEFASYLADGKSMALPDGGLACARCHRQAESRDFVFAARFPPEPAPGGTR